MSVIVARSLGVVNSGGAAIPTISATVLPTITQAVDSIALATFRTAKWLVTITDNTNDRILAYEVFGTITNGTTPTHTRYGVIGDTTISHLVDVVISGINVELTITNNEADDLQIDAIRLQVS